QEGLEIGQSRTAIDPVHLAVNLKLPRMTRGAGYSDGLESSWAGRVKADAGHIIRQERLAVLPFQRLQPRQIDQTRALIAGVEIRPRGRCPAWALLDIYGIIRSGLNSR